MPARPGNRRTSTALLAVASDCRRPRVDAGGTRLRLRALAVMGHGSARIARAAGVSDQAIQKLTRGDAKTVSPQLRDAVAAVYDAWWDKRAPERHPRRTRRGQRGPAAGHPRELVRRSWPGRRRTRHPRIPARPRLACPPSGTGIAADIHPAAREQVTELGA